ncbi:MAG: SDR family NAD(P)-dependent oxidoreductase [Chloroflexota bacterium]
MYDFTDRVVMVAGATGNLGTAVARAFQAAGAKLVLVDRSADRLARMFPDLASSPHSFLANSVDLTNAEAVAGMVEETVRRFGRIDVLANTAGGFRGGTPSHETPQETWDFLFNLNVRAILVPCRSVVPQMLAQGSGKIINVAARAALSGSAGLSAYTASKSAAVRLTESMAAELKDQGINVNCILPGTIDTPQNRQDRPDVDPGRFVTPEALADVILFLASDAARAIHGAAIPVYGRS